MGKISADKTVFIQGHSVIFSNFDKVFWKDENYTKGDVFQYYHELAPIILPHLKDRPMVLHRHPQGIKEEGFFQKDTSELHLPNWIKTMEIAHTTGVVRYLMVQDEASLMYVVNLGCIELNPFNARFNYLKYPDFLVWDLDPEDISFDHVIEVALVIHDILEKIGVKSYCKTSGGRGLHIYVPLAAQYSFETAKNFGKLVATLVNQKLPEITSLERMPAKRQKRVYIDTLQNEHTKTLAAPYCLRPKAHAPVATPLKWSELKPSLKPDDFNIKTVPTRVKKIGDIFKPVLGPGMDLKKVIELLR